MLDVQVDVGGAVPAGGQEALEEQAVPDRVHVRDPERVAHGGVGRRAAALTQDAVVLAELHDVVHDQEVAGEAEVHDDLEFALDLGVRPVDAFRPSVAFRRPFPDQLAQPTGLGVVLGNREVRQLGRDHVEVKRAGPGELGGLLRRAGIPA